MPNSPSLAEHQANYAKLVSLAKADHERRLAPHVQTLTKIQQELAPLEAALAVKPWPRRWWGYLKSCSLYYKIPWFLVIVLPGLAFLVSKNPPLTKLIAIAFMLLMTLGVVYIGRDELKLQVKHRKPHLRDLEADEATIVASYLKLNQTPIFAFVYSLEATKKQIWSLHAQALTLAKARGHGPEIDQAIWSAKLYAELQERLAERIAIVADWLTAIGKWAWQDGTLDYSAFAHAERLSAMLEVMALHERLNTLWRFPDDGGSPVNVQETLRSAEWTAIDEDLRRLNLFMSRCLGD